MGSGALSAAIGLLEIERKGLRVTNSKWMYLRVLNASTERMLMKMLLVSLP